MDREQLDISHDLAFTCRRCAACCRGRIVPLMPGEKGKYEALGLASTGAAGQAPFVAMDGQWGSTTPAFRLAQVDGRCVFLADDNSCSIHNLHGYEAKPLACRQFPFLFAREPESVVVSASFACPSVAEGYGTPLRKQEGDIRTLLSEGLSGHDDGQGPEPAGGFSVPDRVLLAANIGLDWYSYQALERAIIDILEDESHTLAVRLLAAYTLVDGAVAEYGRGTKTTSAFVIWMEHMISGPGQRWIYQESMAGKSPGAGTRRRLLAPLIWALETGYAARLGLPSPSGGFQGLAALARGSGQYYLPSLGASVDLGAARQVAFDHDSPEHRALLVRYLVEALRRKVLLKHPNVLKGIQYLLVRFALVKWYAACLAALHGRGEVGAEESRGAIRIVERCYDQEDELTRTLASRPRLRFLMDLQLDMLSSPVDLVLSAADIARHQPGGEV